MSPDDSPKLLPFRDWRRIGNLLGGPPWLRKASELILDRRNFLAPGQPRPAAELDEEVADSVIIELKRGQELAESVLAGQETPDALQGRVLERVGR